MNNNTFNFAIFEQTGGYGVVIDSLNYLLDLYRQPGIKLDAQVGVEIENILKIIKIIKLLKSDTAAHEFHIATRTPDCLTISDVFLKAIFRFILNANVDNDHFDILISFYMANKNELSKYVSVVCMWKN